MKTTPILAAALLLSISLTPALLRADDGKPAAPPPSETPKPVEPKKEEPKAEEPKKEEPKPEAPKKEEPKAEEPKKEEPKKEEPDSEQPGKGKEASGSPAAHEKYSRETAEILKAWEPALDEVRRATVKLTREGKDIALGCAVHENGYILTKAGEVFDKKGVFLTGIEASFPEGLRLPVKLVDTHRPYDLALLKVDARGLRAIQWDESITPEPGTFLAAATPMRLPVAVGVLSVIPRNLDDSHKGWLGVKLDKASDKEVKVIGVSADSPASKAGMVSDDIIKSIDGKSVTTMDEFIQTVGSLRPYQTIKIVVKREKGDQELDATLAPRPPGMGALAEDPRNMMSGSLSKNRRGFPDALQHDMVLQPNEVGGPLVNLDGKVVGMNIARSGRIECLAIPSKTVKMLLSKVSEGRFYHPELDALRDERKNAEAALSRVKSDLEALTTRIKEAEGPAAPGDGEKK